MLKTMSWLYALTFLLFLKIDNDFTVYLMGVAAGGFAVTLLLYFFPDIEIK